MQELGVISNHTIFEDDDKRVYFTAGAAIDADGANGQAGQPAAYTIDDRGTDLLANGGMKMSGGKVICAKSWARDIVLLDSDNEPKVFAGGMIASMTWYVVPEKLPSDPAAYVDAETVPYVVVPPLIIQRTTGMVRGCKARVTWKNRSVDCVVADKGRRDRIGELSIAAARAIEMNCSPRTGGVIDAVVLYELWPGTAAPGFVLQPA